MEMFGKCLLGTSVWVTPHSSDLQVFNLQVKIQLIKRRDDETDKDKRVTTMRIIYDKTRD